MTETNKCDLKEAKRLALEKFVELSYKDGWEVDISGFDLQFIHEASGFRMTNYGGLVCVYLSGREIGRACCLPPQNKGEEYSAIKSAYERITATLEAKRDSVECHEIMAALGRIKS